MNFRRLYDFLRDLQANNSKEWMDDHRKRYHDIRDEYIEWLEELDQRLSKIEGYHSTDGKRAINRINNNLLYHPDRPTYKDHIGAGLDDAAHKKTGDFYIHLGINESFIAGGFYKTSGDTLNSIREAIDYNGEKLKEIMEEKDFQEYFGGMMDDPDKLKTSPKGYSKEHPHIDLLRRKTFAVMHTVTQEQVISDDFQSTCVEVYKAMKPFRDYLNKAVSV